MHFFFKKKKKYVKYNSMYVLNMKWNMKFQADPSVELRGIQQIHVLLGWHCFFWGDFFPMLPSATCSIYNRERNVVSNSSP